MNKVSSKAFNDALKKMGLTYYNFTDIKLDKYGHSFHYYYQIGLLENYSEEDIVCGVISSLQYNVCDALHCDIFKDILATDECRMFKHPDSQDGGRDHFNMRWFKEWCEANNPQLLNKVYRLKAFW